MKLNGHGNGYETQLTPRERQKLHARLAKPDVCLREVEATAPVFRSGQFQGTRPTAQTLGKIAARLREEIVMERLWVVSQVRQGVMARLREENPGDGVESVMHDTALVMANDLFAGTVEDKDPERCDAKFRLLLKWKDSELGRFKFEWMKKKFQEGAEAMRAKEEAEKEKGKKEGAITAETWERIEKELRLL